MAQTRALQMVGATGLGWYGREYLPFEWLQKLGKGGDENDQLRSVLSKLGKKLDQQPHVSNSLPSQTIVVRDRSRSGGAVAGFVVLGILYLRFWKGIRIEDWQPLTRGSLRDAVSKFSDSIDTMRSALAATRTAMAERIEKLKETIARIREEISQVHDDVRDVKTDVDATRALAESCDRRLLETSQKQDYANHGIQALCAVVGDLLRNAANTPAIEQLRSFTTRHLPGPPQPNNENPSLLNAAPPTTHMLQQETLLPPSTTIQTTSSSSS